MGKYKRKRINCTVCGVDIYNLSPDEVKELKEFLSELNAKVVENMGKVASKAIDEKRELTEDDIQEMRSNGIMYQSNEINKKTKEFLLKYTSLKDDDIDDEDILDPSPELKLIFKKMMKICIRPVLEEIQEYFDTTYENFTKSTINKMELGM